MRYLNTMITLMPLLLLLLVGQDAEGLDHSIVFPVLLESRADGAQKIVRLTGKQTLSLEKASVLADLISLKTYENGKYVEKYIRGSPIEQNLYSDPHRMASLMLDETGGAVKLTGMISLTERIEPMGEERSMQGAVPHRISKIVMRNPIGSRVRQIRDVSAVHHASAETTTDYPPNVRFEVFVISDSYHNKFFNSTPSALLRYLAIMFNSVNLRFRTVSDPRIDLLLVGVEESKSEPYVDAMIPESRPEGFLLDDDILDTLEKYVRKEYVTENPDMVYLMTGRDIFAQELFTNKIEKGASGIANVGGLCTEEKVAAGEDKAGSFDGTDTVAHELAHLLGAVHDGTSAVRRIPKHPGALSCRWEDGYIMSYKDTGENHFKFSECSKEQFRVVFRQRSPSCFDVKSNPVVSPDEVGYAGLYLHASTYCELTFPEKTGIYAASTVKHLAECRLFCCRGEPEPDECYKKPLLDLMRCAEGKRCFNGVCRNFPV